MSKNNLEKNIKKKSKLNINFMLNYFILNENFLTTRRG